MSSSVGYLFVDITHNLLKHRFVEQRIDSDWKLEQLKDKLHLITGTSIDYMRIIINGIEFSNPSISIQSAFPSLSLHGTHIHIIDSDPHSALKGFNEDDLLNTVEKFTISDEEYNKRSDNARAWKERMIAEKKRKAEEEKKKAEEEKKAEGNIESTMIEIESEESIRSRIKINDRCEISPGARRGIVRFIGLVPEISAGASTAPTIWIGVELDEPYGKHDGSIKSKRYFNAASNHGTFVKSSMIKTGDYPERDPFDDDEENKEEGGEGEGDDIYKEL